MSAASPFSAFARISPSTTSAADRVATCSHSAGREGFFFNLCRMASGIDNPTMNRKKGKTMSTYVMASTSAFM